MLWFIGGDALCSGSLGEMHYVVVHWGRCSLYVLVHWGRCIMLWFIGLESVISLAACMPETLLHSCICIITYIYIYHLI